LHSFVVLYETNILSLVSQNLNNFYQIQTKCYLNSDTSFFFPIHRSKRGLSPIKGAKTPEATRPGTLLLASTVLWPLLAAAAATMAMQHGHQ
jgi:hypothetical protein